mgnify:CR=1 FL=1
MRISHLSIVNFGPHRSLEVDFGPGINIIRGQNRTGKTWILRALDQVFFNEGGLECVSYGQKFFRIVVTMDDGSVIERYRDRFENSYTINGTKYTAVGSGPFDPVVKLTGIRAVALDGKSESRPNIKTPLDPRFFIVGETPQKQAKILARLVGADVLEAAVSDTISDQRRASDERRRLQRQAEEARIEAESYAGVETKLKQAWSVVELEKQAKEVRSKAETAIRLSEHLFALVQRRETVGPQFAQLTQALDQWAHRRDDLSRRHSRQQKILELFRTLRDLAPRIPRLEALLKTIERGEELSRRSSLIRETAASINNKFLVAKALQEQHVRLSSVREQLEWATKDLAQLEMKRKQTLEESGVCPLCRRPF